MNNSLLALTVTMAAVTSFLTAACRPTRPETSPEIDFQITSADLCTYQVIPEPNERAPLVPDSFRSAITPPATCDYDAGQVHETNGDRQPDSRLKKWSHRFKERRAKRIKRRHARRELRRNRRKASTVHG